MTTPQQAQGDERSGSAADRAIPEADGEVDDLQAVPATARTTQEDPDHDYFGLTSPQTPVFAYSQPYPSSSALSSALSSAPSFSIGTPASVNSSQPAGLTPGQNPLSPPETSRSAILSTASSANNFAFRPPSDHNSVRFSYSGGRPPTRILSTESASPYTGLQTHWEHQPSAVVGAENVQSLPESEKDTENGPHPQAKIWEPIQKLGSSLEPSGPLGPSVPVQPPYLGETPEKSRETLSYPTTDVPYDSHLDSEAHEEDSPYPEVRASVSNTDDPDMPCFTFRVWLIGLMLSFAINGANMFLYLRFPTTGIIPSLTITIGYVAGKLLARVLPLRLWDIGGYEFSLNPGPFNIKEHVLIYMLSGGTLCNTPPVGMGVVVAWEKRYMQSLQTGFIFLFIISSQLAGLGLAGLLRSLFVYPAFAIWPTILPTASMLNTLHAENDETSDRKSISRFRFFWVVAAGACLWSFVPGYLFTGLSYFSFICWIWPRNIVVNQLFGSVTGLGLNIVTLDWTQVAYIGAPMIAPLWALVQVFLGFVLLYWILAPIFYYSNIWKSGHLPLLGTSGYDRFAQPYNLSRVFDPQTFQLNSTAYEEYSPLYLPVSFVFTYILAFAGPPALLTQTILHFGPTAYRILHSKKKMEDRGEDIHLKLMRRYPEAPLWCYFAVFASCLALSVGVVFVQPDLNVPISAIALSITLAVLFIIPECYLSSITGLGVPLNLFAQIIPGVLWPGKPMINMMFKVYALGTAGTATSCVIMLKLGHYMKVPPRFTLLAIILGTVIATIVQIGVEQLIFASVQDVCEPGQAAHLTCARSQVFYTASIIWGLVGPKRQFGRGGTYYGPVYAVAAGAALPGILWWWRRRFRTPSWFNSFNIAVVLIGPTMIPPGTGINYTSWLTVGFIFQYYLRTRRYRWWSRYNYVLSAALDSGNGVGMVLCFLILQLRKGGTPYLNWWGNTVWQNTADADGTPFYSTDPVNGF